MFVTLNHSTESEKVVPALTNEEDAAASNNLCGEHVVHVDEGTHKSLLPVSNITLNVCGGVPILMSP
jgi:hypothetical protein